MGLLVRSMVDSLEVVTEGGRVGMGCRTWAVGNHEKYGIIINYIYMNSDLHSVMPWVITYKIYHKYMSCKYPFSMKLCIAVLYHVSNLAIPFYL